MYFGSWAVKGTEKMMGEASVKLVEMGKITQGQAIKRMLLKGLVGMAVSPIMEVFQEIIEDGFKEALAENIVGILGGTDDLGFWISSYWTAGREATGALGQLSLGTSANLQNSISLVHAVISGDAQTRLEIQQRIAQDLKLKQETEAAKLAQMGFWDKILKTDFLKGLFMVIPSVLFGSFSFVALSGFSKMITSSIKLSPAAYAKFKSRNHNGRKILFGKAVGGQETYSVSNKVLEQTKKPAELDSVASDLNNEFKDQQKSGIISQSQTQTTQVRATNSNPKNTKISNILNKFKNLISGIWSDKFEVKKIEGSLVVEDIDKIVDKSFQSKKSDVKLDKIIGDDFEGLFPEHDKATINYIHSKLFDLEYDQNKPEGVLEQIIYRSDLILEARQVLKSAKYNGLDILIDEIINPEVLDALQDKFSKGEEFSKLERIIADVASFYMGGGLGKGFRWEKVLDAISGPTKVVKKDSRSPMGKQVIQYKKDRLKQIIIDQLQHYSQTGERLYASGKEVQAESGFSQKSVVRHAAIILEQIFTDPESASLIYEMIFGRIKTSIHEIKRKCIDKRLLLKTTSVQWFDMLKNKGKKTPSQLYVEVECIARGHKNSVQIKNILGCWDCIPLGFQDFLKLASEHNIQAISFFDDSQQLTEREFNELVKEYNTQHQDPDDYKTGTLVFLNLEWKCLECDHIFEQTYRNIRRSKIKHYCPKCVSSIDQQKTFEAAVELFQDYTTQNFRSDVQLYKFLPNRILLMPKYQVISDPRVHVDVYGVISTAGKEFKIAIEHQGPQHYSLEAYINMARGYDIKSGIYKTDAEYKIMFDAQVERDRAKVQLFKDLNKDGYYLIVVPHWVPPGERKSFILQKFIEQTGVNPGQASIVDYL